MKMMKRFAIMLMLVCASAMVLSGCGKSDRDSGKKENAYKIGIMQLVEHPALDEATRGFKEGIISVLGEDKVTFDEQNAQGEDANCATIANSFVTDKVALIMANATPALQAAAAATAFCHGTAICPEPTMSAAKPTRRTSANGFPKTARS